MVVWRSLADVDDQLGPSVATIGVFDGVHRGHQAVLNRARAVAEEQSTPEYSVPVVAVTFDPHPLAVLVPARAPALLTTVDHRAQLLRVAGARHVLALPFDREMAGWSPEEFVRRVLVDTLRADAVVVGATFRFGHRAAGDVPLMRALGDRYGFRVEGVALDGEGRPWSSTYVRQCLSEGDVEEAARALGRRFSLEGVVVRGDQRGRQLGYPTANLPTSPGLAVPGDGVYAGLVRRLDSPLDASWPAAVSVGSNPTFDGVQHRVESYVLDRDDLELYGVSIEVSFVRRLRGQRRFDDVDGLVEQMRADCAAARAALAAVTAGQARRGSRD